MINSSEMRMSMLDEVISLFSCMRRINDKVVIKMSPDVFHDLLADHLRCNAVEFTSNHESPTYKGNPIIIDKSKENLLAVAYFNTDNGKEHNIRELKEDDNAI